MFTFQKALNLPYNQKISKADIPLLSNKKAKGSFTLTTFITIGDLK